MRRRRQRRRSRSTSERQADGRRRTPVCVPEAGHPRLTDRRRFRKVVDGRQANNDRGPLTEARYSAMAVVALHLRVETRWTQLQAVANLVDLIEDLLGRLIWDRPPTRVAKDHRAVSLHIEALPLDRLCPTS